MKHRINLTESQLRKVIMNSVKRVLKENRRYGNINEIYLKPYKDTGYRKPKAEEIILHYLVLSGLDMQGKLNVIRALRDRKSCHTDGSGRGEDDITAALSPEEAKVCDKIAEELIMHGALYDDFDKAIDKLESEAMDRLEEMRAIAKKILKENRRRRKW